ncbi:hypothetical protein POM88_002196 [Heracleum sosnowskyi]|uniref:Uncharacterized protein n=1 Tax=Heracleum sosnowskyi TaxID=360622 RepID=A0AAD8JF66_9APIA|nr:hypothetical protein POM88_002196 [Heracleum sosnowskyi]
MEVMMPLSSSAVIGDNLMFSRSTCTSPCAPQSPQNASNYFFSAPSSPTNSSPFNRQISFAFDAIANIQVSENTHHQSEDRIDEDEPVDSANLDHSIAKKYFSFNFYVTDDQDDGEDSKTKEEDVEFDFEAATQDDVDDGTTKEDFTFDFLSGQAERSIPSVNQVFRGGLINTIETAPKKTLQNAVSFRQRKKYSDPCAKSTERVRNSPNYMNGRKKSPKALNTVSERVNTKISYKAAPSTPRSTPRREATEQVISMERNSSSSSSWLVKWKLPDLLFRSASEGHESKKKYEIEGKNMNENMKMSSGGSGSNGGSRKKKERVSGHELNNKVNRAAETRRKTFLPYKQNLMGCKSLDALIVLEPSVRGINGSQVRRQ